MKTLNIKNLKQLGACKEGIDFVKQYNLEGFPLDKLDFVKGDYEGFVIWLKDLSKPEYEYDSDNNLIKEVNPYGDTWLYEYDSNNNLIKKVDPNEDTWLYEYKYHKSGSLYQLIQNDEVILEIPEFLGVL